VDGKRKIDMQSKEWHRLKLEPGAQVQTKGRKEGSYKKASPGVAAQGK